MARVEETPHGICFPVARQKVRFGQNKAHFLVIEATSKSARAGVVKDAEGNIIQEAPLPVWANLRQRALDAAIAEITKKTDLNIALESLDRSKHRRVTSVTFASRPKRYQTVINLVKSNSSISARLPDFVEPMKTKPNNLRKVSN